MFPLAAPARRQLGGGGGGPGGAGMAGGRQALPGRPGRSRPRRRARVLARVFRAGPGLPRPAGPNAGGPQGAGGLHRRRARHPCAAAALFRDPDHLSHQPEQQHPPDQRDRGPAVPGGWASPWTGRAGFTPSPRPGAWRSWPRRTSRSCGRDGAAATSWTPHAGPPPAGWTKPPSAPPRWTGPGPV